MSWLESYALRAGEPRAPGQGAGGAAPLLPAHLRTGTTLLGPGEHPFPTRTDRRVQMRIEPSVYLDAWSVTSSRFGGRIVIRTSAHRGSWWRWTNRSSSTAPGSARATCSATTTGPAQGQLTVLVPQPEVDYGTFGGLPGSSRGGGLGIHMQPRSDGVVLGGTSERGAWSLEPDQEAMKRIVDAHRAVFSAMRS